MTITSGNNSSQPLAYERDVRQAAEYRRLSEILFVRFAELFPYYVWVGDEAAIDLMTATIISFRNEAKAPEQYVKESEFFGEDTTT